MQVAIIILIRGYHVTTAIILLSGPEMNFTIILVIIIIIAEMLNPDATWAQDNYCHHICA